MTAPRSALRDDGHLIPVEDVRIVPASVTVLDGDSLAAQKLDQITDYAAFLPGLSLDTAGVPSANIVILRGIASLTEASSVGYYIDDTPIGASGGWGYACCTSLDLMTFDLERLEVLRGPQGTSHGASFRERHTQIRPQGTQRQSVRGARRSGRQCDPWCCQVGDFNPGCG